jgi:hypothetical protein
MNRVAPRSIVVEAFTGNPLGLVSKTSTAPRAASDAGVIERGHENACPPCGNGGRGVRKGRSVAINAPMSAPPAAYCFALLVYGFATATIDAYTTPAARRANNATETRNERTTRSPPHSEPSLPEPEGAVPEIGALALDVRNGVA